MPLDSRETLQLSKARNFRIEKKSRLKKVKVESNIREQVRGKLPEGVVATTLAEVPKLLTQGAHVVFYKDPESIPDFQRFEEIIGIGSNLDFNITSIFGRDTFDELKEDLEALPSEVNDLKEKIIEDIKNILKNFPKKNLKKIFFRRFKYWKDEGSKAGLWHKDTLGMKIRILKTYTGPLTEYALSSSNEATSLSSSPGVTTFHTKDAVHRRPGIGAGIYRFQLLIDLE
jgi:hypothetical protein